MDIGSRFKEIRNFHKLSANKLGDSLGVDPSTITKIERGHSLPSLKLLINFCKFFNITLSEFFSSNESDNTNVLSPELKRLLNNAKNLNDEEITKLNELIVTFTKNRK